MIIDVFCLRCKDLAAQNNILHQHLESVSSQAARIREAADSSATNFTGDGESAEDSTDTKLAELRSVVAYLRKEKDIVDLQLELSKQETTRLRTQVEHLDKSLAETRKALSEVSPKTFPLEPVMNIWFRNASAPLKQLRLKLSMLSSWNASTS